MSRIASSGQLAAIVAADVALQARDLAEQRVEHTAILANAHDRAARVVSSLSPNRRSNTARGWFSIGSGVVGFRHDSVFAYAQL
jgi:hypothetical protein